MHRGSAVVLLAPAPAARDDALIRRPSAADQASPWRGSPFAAALLTSSASHRIIWQNSR
jgi:hypothetical protein